VRSGIEAIVEVSFALLIHLAKVGRRCVQSSNYWSATTNANNSTNAWNVNFNNGNVNTNNKTNNNFV